MTYNVHRCVGADGALDPARVARVIAAARPDVVALQELDVRRARTGRADQPALIAAALGMDYHFHAALEVEGGHYGNAVLSRRPLRLVRAGALPTVPRRLVQVEPRGALWVEADCGGRPVQLINTHLGLSSRERAVQVKELLGPHWLGDPACAGPRLLVGDLNAWPGSQAYRALRARDTLRDAQHGDGAWPRNTFPARCPVLRLDHVLHSPDLRVRAVKVPRDRLARAASDHLPLVVEVSLP